MDVPRNLLLPGIEQLLVVIVIISAAVGVVQRSSVVLVSSWCVVGVIQCSAAILGGPVVSGSLLVRRQRFEFRVSTPGIGVQFQCFPVLRQRSQFRLGSAAWVCFRIRWFRLSVEFWGSSPRIGLCRFSVKFEF